MCCIPNKYGEYEIALCCIVHTKVGEIYFTITLCLRLLILNGTKE